MKCCPRGFSLLEMICALAITTVVCALCASFLTSLKKQRTLEMNMPLNDLWQERLIARVETDFKNSRIVTQTDEHSCTLQWHRDGMPVTVRYTLNDQGQLWRFENSSNDGATSACMAWDVSGFTLTDAHFHLWFLDQSSAIVYRWPLHLSGVNP